MSDGVCRHMKCLTCCESTGHSGWKAVKMESFTTIPLTIPSPGSRFHLSDSQDSAVSYLVHCLKLCVNGLYFDLVSGRSCRSIWWWHEGHEPEDSNAQNFNLEKSWQQCQFGKLHRPVPGI